MTVAVLLSQSLVTHPWHYFSGQDRLVEDGPQEQSVEGRVLASCLAEGLVGTGLSKLGSVVAQVAGSEALLGEMGDGGGGVGVCLRRGWWSLCCWRDQCWSAGIQNDQTHCHSEFQPSLHYPTLAMIVVVHGSLCREAKFTFLNIFPTNHFILYANPEAVMCKLFLWCKQYNKPFRLSLNHIKYSSYVLTWMLAFCWGSRASIPP